MNNYLWLPLLGLMVGAFGTMIGAGGGFILVPILLILYPNKTPEEITSISLAVVFFNALSGSIAYNKMKRIDFKSGIMFSAATIPGAILGSIVVGMISRSLFDGIFGSLLIIIAIYLTLRPKDELDDTAVIPSTHTIRKITDAESNEYIYGYNKYLGLILSTFVGFISSLLGIGGGIIHVPALVHLLNFPVHIATATSHFVLSIMALSGSAVHYFSGTLSNSFLEIGLLSVGAIIGAQIGARLSKKIQGKIIIRALALALGIVGIRILLLAF